MLTEERIKELAYIAVMRNDVEEAIRLAVAETAEACAQVCRRRAEERQSDYGYTEHDTNASYYTGPHKYAYEAMDEEDEECAAAILKAARGMK